MGMVLGQKHGFLLLIHQGGKTEADFESRHFSGRSWWSLHKSIFHRLVTLCGRPDLDLFASVLNAKWSYLAWQRTYMQNFVMLFKVLLRPLCLCFYYRS